jgi:hypothetical protein
VLLPTALVLLSLVSASQAVTVQDPGNVLPDGSAYLWVEGEDAHELGGSPPADATTGFILVDKVNPFQTVDTAVKGDLDVLPADTNASGGAAVFQALEGGGTAKWQVQFANPATYYLYVHWTMYNRDTNTGYGNEDSFYLPPAFNKNSRSDWIGFDGVDEFGAPKVGDGDRDGYIDGFASLVNVPSAGVIETHNTTDEDFWDGQFHWLPLYRANDMDANGGFLSFAGHGIKYEVTPAEVGMVLDFEISTREPYGSIDGFLFSTSNTLLEDYTQEQMDEFFIDQGAPALQAGDADQDLDFDQLDLVKVQIAAKYLTGQTATWGEGDWNGAPGGQVGSPPAGNGLFNQQDIIAAQLADKYLKGKYAALAPGDGVRGDGQTSIVYNPATGEVAVDAPATTQLTSINIDSASGIFTGAPAQNLGGSFDNDSDTNVFKATFGSSFGTLSFGNVAQPGLSKALVTNDLTVVGSLAGGGALGPVDLIYVPEPATILLASLGLVALVSYAWRRGKPMG